MNLKKPLITTHNLGFLFAVMLLAFFSSCSSSNPFVSRKYTRGHFSDPVARINTEQIPGSLHISLVPLHSQTQNLKTSSISVIQKIAVAKAKPLTKQRIHFTTQQKSLKVARSNGLILFGLTSPFSINAISDYVSGGYYADHGKSGSVSVLALGLIFLGVSLIFLMLGLVGGFDPATSGICFICFGLFIGLGVVLIAARALAAMTAAMNSSS